MPRTEHSVSAVFCTFFHPLPSVTVLNTIARHE